VKRVLRKYGYPPDRQEKATRTVLEQAEVLSEAWTEGRGAARRRPPVKTDGAAGDEFP